VGKPISDFCFCFAVTISRSIELEDSKTTYELTLLEIHSY